MTAPEDSASPPTLAYEPNTITHPPLAVLIGLVGLRLIGLYLAVTAIATLPIVAGVVWAAVAVRGSTMDWPGRWIGLVGSVSCSLVIGLILFIKAPTLARRMFGRVHHDGSSLSADAMLTLVIAAIGLWAVVSSLNYLAQTIWNLFFSVGAYRRTSASTALMDFQTAMSVLTAVVQPAVGVLLILYAPRLSRVGMQRFHDARNTQVRA